MDESDEANEMENIKQCMKDIVIQTNNILKHSAAAFRRTKEKTLSIDTTMMIPNEKTKIWFNNRNIETITIPDFFDLFFKEYSEKNMLDFPSKTIRFNEDAVIFGFKSHESVSILDFFEKVPTYFKT